MAQKRDNIIKHSIKSLQLLYHANPCNHVLQVLQTTSLVYVVFPYSGPGISSSCKDDATVKPVYRGHLHVHVHMGEKIVACLQELALEKRSKFYIWDLVHDRWLLTHVIQASCSSLTMIEFCFDLIR